MTDQDRLENLRKNFEVQSEQLEVAIGVLKYLAEYSEGSWYDAEQALKKIQEIGTRCCREDHA